MNLKYTLRRPVLCAAAMAALLHASVALGGTFGPTLLVNTEAYAVIEDQDASANVVLKFGDTLAKTLSYNRTLSRFEFSDTLAVAGSVRATATVSGATIYGQRYEGAGLSDCDNAVTSKLLWDTTTKTFSCGTDQGGGSGMSQTDGDLRYVQRSGGSMTGTLTINVPGTGSVGLSVVDTASGATVHAQNQLRSSGSLVIEGASNLQGTLTFGDAIGDAITVHSGTWSFQNAVNFATTNAVNALSVDTDTLSVDALNNRIGVRTAAPENPLEVVGTISGTVLRTTGTVFSSGSVVVENDLTAATLRGAGLSDCDTANTSKLLWDTTTGTFSCGTDQGGAGGGLTQGDADLRYVKRSGGSMTGTLTINVPGTGSVGLSVVDTASGATVHAQNQLRSSGSLVIDGIATLNQDLDFAAINDPASPDAGFFTIYAKNVNGRMMLKGKGPSGVDYAYQPNLYNNVVTLISPAATTTLNVIGAATTNSATLSHPAATEALGYNTNFATSTTSGNESGFITTGAQYFRGSTTGSNGFFFFARVVTIDTTLLRIFVGLNDQTTLANIMASDNTAGNRAGFAFSTARGDTNWQVTLKDGTTQNLINTSMAFAANKVYDLYLYTPPFGAPNAGTMYWRIDNITDSTTQSNSTASNLPTGSTALRAALGVETQTTAAKSFRMNRMYIEADR